MALRTTAVESIHDARPRVLDVAEGPPHVKINAFDGTSWCCWVRLPRRSAARTSGPRLRQLRGSKDVASRLAVGLALQPTPVQLHVDGRRLYR